MAEIMFETFNVKGLFIGVQATLALYAQISGGGVEQRQIG
jgi:actin-related protein